MRLQQGLKQLLYPFLCVLIGCATASKQQQESSPKLPPIPPRHLVLGLDGVGYSTIKKMYDGGYFRDFNQPAQMVASFPTVSDPNWARLLQAPLSQSYTKSFYTMSVKNGNGIGQPVGSLIDHLTVPPKYEEGFDFKAEGVLQHFAMMTWTETSALYWLDALEKQFLATRNKDTFYAFIMNTDIIAHVVGEKALLEYLSALDKRLKKLRTAIMQQYGYLLNITLVSDHGNYFTKPNQINYESILKKHNWAIKDSIENKNDVGIVIPEIIAFGSLYCTKGFERQLALDLSETEGIHVTAYVHGPNRIRVISKNGANESEIYVDPDLQLVNYKVIKGEDSLKQKGFFKDKSLSWKEYLNLSIKSEYPYSAVRLWEGFYRNSREPGSVLASPRLGRVFANQTLKMLTMLRGLASTHGSLHREETMGIFMSTKDTYPPIRPEDFGVFIPLKEYKENLKLKESN